ncbi:hypothetical protein AVEN_133608-1 [Araneus ventricosus]|uniref:Uncharacterized protein n=1 Tax=Araneus ventricosus TaxID=182803 RepID=A0A4Y2JYQ0_ARAVE|nr:hypothetical protein AVEN_133608-1 [Araneus ventricosus]
MKTKNSSLMRVKHINQEEDDDEMLFLPYSYLCGNILPDKNKCREKMLEVCAIQSGQNIFIDFFCCYQIKISTRLQLHDFGVEYSPNKFGGISIWNMSIEFKGRCVKERKEKRSLKKSRDSRTVKDIFLDEGRSLSSGVLVSSQLWNRRTQGSKPDSINDPRCTLYLTPKFKHPPTSTSRKFKMACVCSSIIRMRYRFKMIKSVRK